MRLHAHQKSIFVILKYNGSGGIGASDVTLNLYEDIVFSQISTLYFLKIAISAIFVCRIPNRSPVK